ncbi:MAG: hypothetical protein R2867_31285 [Caldilineaceae bacterium]
MADRDFLIARKQAVRREIEQVRRTLEREQSRPTPIKRRIAPLESQLEKLMAEEYTLRVAIDQAR